MTVEQKEEVGGDMPGWHEVSGPKCEVTHKSLRYIHLYNMKRVVKTDGDIGSSALNRLSLPKTLIRTW